MARQIVAETGFYNGQFLKAGQSYEDGDGAIKLDRLNKEDLLAEAKLRGVEIDPSKTKAEIISAIEAKA